MKTYTLIFDPQSAIDIQAAIDYYNSIYGSLADKFINALEIALTQLKQNPFYQIKYSNTRLLQIKRFPYAIHYSIDEKHDEIHVYAVVHTVSDPDKTWLWQEE